MTEAFDRRLPRPRLVPVAAGADFAAYRDEVIFACRKWDPMVGDVCTISDSALLIPESTAAGLARWAEGLAAETTAIENALIRRPDLWKRLGLSPVLRRVLSRADSGFPETFVRLLRFDFHPTQDGWAVTEVNSDVPGGFAEATELCRIAKRRIDASTGTLEIFGDVAVELVAGFDATAKTRRIGFVHATSYADDRQVMEFLASRFDAAGYETLFLAPDHLEWRDGRARSLLDSRGEELGGLVRFFPAEWLPNLPRGSHWKKFFGRDGVPVCNPGAAVLAQSKRLPLVWDELGVALPYWKGLLPDTIDPREARRRDGAWIFKPAWGRVGDSVTVPGTMTDKDLRRVRKAARRDPRDWVAQRLLQSEPVDGRHVVVGVFTVNGKACGFYSRSSLVPRIDERAQDIPVLIEKEPIHG